LDISGYHADFHEGQGTIRAWQGHSMAGERHGHGMLCLNRPLMYSAWGVKQCDKLDAATPFTEIVLLLFSTNLGQDSDAAVGGYPGHTSAYC